VAGRGKGNMERVVPVSPKLRRSQRRYLKILRLMGGVPLCAGSRGRRRDVGQLRGVETMRAPSCRGNRLSDTLCHSQQRIVS
jgi:hypothetical protein